MTKTIKPEIGKRNEKIEKLRPFVLIYFLIPISYFLKSSSIPLSENTYVKLIVIPPAVEQGLFDWECIG
jgi:hypothetical protein